MKLHWALIDIWGLFIRLSIIELVCEPFENISLLVILMFSEWQQFGDSFMIPFASWSRVDIHWIWGLSNPSLGSLDHCLHYHFIFGDMIFFGCTNMSWSSFFAPSHFSHLFPIIYFHTSYSIFIYFLHWYTSLIY